MPRSTIYGLTAVSLTYLVIFLAGFIRNEEIQQDRDYQYICDGYAQDQESAPAFCK